MGKIYLGPGTTTEILNKCLADASIHTVYLLKGTYRFDDTVVIPAGKSLVGLNQTVLDLLADEDEEQ